MQKIRLTMYLLKSWQSIKELLIPRVDKEMVIYIFHHNSGSIKLKYLFDIILFLFIPVTDSSIQGVNGSALLGVDSILDGTAGAVTRPPNRCDALSPVFSPTSPMSDTEQTTGTNLLILSQNRTCLIDQWFGPRCNSNSFYFKQFLIHFFSNKVTRMVVG